MWAWGWDQYSWLSTYPENAHLWTKNRNQPKQQCTGENKNNTLEWI